MKFILLKIYILFLLLISSVNASERYGVIFASANLQFVLPQVVNAFYKKYPKASVHIQYASSGNLATYIINEKRDYDIFFSADTFYPNQIYKAHYSATKPKRYAQGSLILVTPPRLNLQKEKLAVLKRDTIRHIAIANKSSSPYGKAAIEALKNSHLYNMLKKKIQYSSDIATVIDNVLWNKDAGFLSKSILSQLPANANKYKWLEVDQALYTPIIQSYVVSKKGLKNKNAMLFLHFLESKKGKKIFADNGYKNIF